MRVTAELSLYPFNAEYIPVIKAFIHAVREHGDMDIETTATRLPRGSRYQMSVFALVRQELKASYKAHGKQVLVCKFIPHEEEPAA